MEPTILLLFAATVISKNRQYGRFFEIRLEEKKDELDISFTGNGFLQNMVRILTGTLLEVGTGKREVREMKEILEGRNRSLAGPMAAAKGLVLINVEYE